MKRILLFVCIGLIVACSDEESQEPTMEEMELEQENPFANTIWENVGSGCNAYYDFTDDKYISSNPCFDSNGEVVLMPWESGTYRVAANLLIVTIQDGCEESRKGTTLPFFFELEENELSLGFEANDLPFKYVRTENAPMPNENTMYGYFDFRNGGDWIEVASCNSPYSSN